MALIIACGALAVAVFLYVFWIEPEPRKEKTRVEREQDFLEERKEMVYEGLRDLQMEYRMGKLSDADYQELKLSYQQQLAEFHAAAEALGIGNLPVPHSEPAALVPGRCPSCGTDNPAANKFCGSCGARLETGVPA